MRSLARWGTLPLLGAPLGSWALGLGEIETGSNLNQPLYAEIPLTATSQELAGLDVSLAPVAEFVRRGLDRPGFLSQLEFDVGTNADGESVIRVTSPQSIVEPFITLVVRATLPNAIHDRAYTVLLDPPLFLPSAAATEPVTAPAARAPAASGAGGAIERPPVTPRVEPEPATVVQAQAAPAAPAEATPAGAPAGQYTVQRGDTLWAIADRFRPSGVSRNQAMISIFEVNPNAFDSNINLLRRGTILRIPPAADFGRVSAADATAEVARQTAAWSGGSAAPSPQLVLLPPSDESVDGAGVGGAGDAASAAEVAALEEQVRSLEQQLAERDRLFELQSAELADLQNQLDRSREAQAAALPPEPAAEPELAADVPAVAEVAAETELESEQLFVDEAEPVEPEAAEPEAAEPAPAQAQAASLQTASTQAEPSLVDRVIAAVTQPFVWAGAGALVILLGALAFLRRRRDSLEDVTGRWEALEAEIDDDVDDAATARIRAKAREPHMIVVEGHDYDETSEESQLADEDGDSGTGFDIGGFDSGTAEINALVESDVDDELDAPAAKPDLADQTLSSQTVINLDQADPVAEADFHMAYGLYDQAADLVTKALDADPNDRALKLKLLEVYFVWGNKEQFLERAQMLRNELGGDRDSDWDKVVIMGKQICPDEPLFSEATAAAGEVDLDLAGTSESAGLDFPFDEAEPNDVDLDFDDDGGLTLAASGHHAAASPSDEYLSDDEVLEIGARTQAGLEAALLEDTDEEEERTSAGEMSSMFDLDATQESPTVETRGRSDDAWDALSAESPTMESPTIESPTFAADGPDAPTVETPTIERPGPAVADGGDTVEQARPAPATDMTAELELGDLGLDVADIENLSDDFGDSPSVDETGVTVEPPSRDSDEDLLSATGVTQVLYEDDDDDLSHTGTAVLEDNDATMMAPAHDEDATGVRTEVLENKPSSFDPDPVTTEEDLDLNLDDFSSALDGGMTAEQPGISGYGVDLDVGDDIIADDEPTGTEAVSLDPQTMTEVGTKLDLARAYIDMGDPEGAKSILEEVLSEGDTGQRREAKALIDALPA